MVLARRWNSPGDCRDTGGSDLEQPTQPSLPQSSLAHSFNPSPGMQRGTSNTTEEEEKEKEEEEDVSEIPLAWPAVQRSPGSGSPGFPASSGTLRQFLLRAIVLAVLFIFSFRVGLSSLTTEGSLIFLLIRR